MQLGKYMPYINYKCSLASILAIALFFLLKISKIALEVATPPWKYAIICKRVNLELFIGQCVFVFMHAICTFQASFLEIAQS